VKQELPLNKHVRRISQRFTNFCGLDPSAVSPASIPCVYFMINGAPVGFHEMPFDSQRFKQGFLQASNLMKEFIRTSRPQNQQSNTLSPEEVEAVKARYVSFY